MNASTKRAIDASNAAYAAALDCWQTEANELATRPSDPTGDRYHGAMLRRLAAEREWQAKRLAALSALTAEFAPELE